MTTIKSFIGVIMQLLGRVLSALETYLAVPKLIGAVRFGYWRSKLEYLGAESYIHPYVIIHSPDKVRIGKKVHIVEFVHIWGGGGVEIGDNVLVASHVIITSQTHDKYASFFQSSNVKRQVIIGDNCWIGAGAVILPGVHIGAGCIVGAQALVNRNVPPRTVVAGIPAHVIEQLDVL